MQEPKIHELSTQKLKNKLGDWEKIYESHCAGERIHNEIIGYSFRGIINWLISCEALNKKANAIIQSGYEIFNENFKIMSELRCRRTFAKNKELNEYDNL